MARKCEREASPIGNTSGLARRNFYSFYSKISKKFGMLKKYVHKKVTWVDLEAPTKEDVQLIVKEYGIHPLVGSELLSPTRRSRVDVYDTFTYLIFHFPTIVHSHSGGLEQEIDFIVGKHFVITAHYEAIDGLHELAKLFEVDVTLQKKDIGTHAGFLFFYMLRHLYNDATDELNILDDSLPKIEEGIFSGKERAMVGRISEISKKMLNFKRTILPHREMLESFELAGKKLYGEEFVYYLRSLSGEHLRLTAMLDGDMDTIAELRATNDSLLNTKTNDIMRTLTIMAFTTFPLTLFASIFSMNTKVLPIVGMENDFWIIIGIMLLVMVSFYMYFRYKKWF